MAARECRGALAPYEPTLFALIDAGLPPPNDAGDIRNAIHGHDARSGSGDASAPASTGDATMTPSHIADRVVPGFCAAAGRAVLTGAAHGPRPTPGVGGGVNG
jgi:hypothetical protein